VQSLRLEAIRYLLRMSDSHDAVLAPISLCIYLWAGLFLSRRQTMILLGKTAVLRGSSSASLRRQVHQRGLAAREPRQYQEASPC
jgi:hypothetical protein